MVTTSTHKAIGIEGGYMIVFPFMVTIYFNNIIPIVYIYLNQGSGYFFHDKMPGCCLPSLTAGKLADPPLK
jgi:hypothetical protein